jgi:hypothetical protein
MDMRYLFVGGFRDAKGGISLSFPTYTGIIANVAAGAARQLNLS